ncbi:MAG: 3-isopropylmalate dehydrogenase [Gammaproteobacteria bacterium]
MIGSDKANVLSSQFFFRSVFDEVAQRYPDIESGHQYVDTTAFDLARCPWRYDVIPADNQFGDILPDICAALMGGMGMSSSGEMGEHHAVFQPRHGSAPDITGQGKANPTGIILSNAIMLNCLGDKISKPEWIKAAGLLGSAVEAAYATGDLLPYELGDQSGTFAIMDLVGKKLSA